MAASTEDVIDRDAIADLLARLGIGDGHPEAAGLRLDLALVCAGYRSELAAWERGTPLKAAVAALHRLETLSGELARAIAGCDAAVLDLLVRPLPLSAIDTVLDPQDLIATWRAAALGELPRAPGEESDWVRRLDALSRLCARTVARVQQEVGAPDADAIARGGRQRAAAVRAPHPSWGFAQRVLGLAERCLGRALGTDRGDAARFGDILDRAAQVALGRPVGLADAYGRHVLRAITRWRAIDRRLDALGASAADLAEKSALLAERAKLRRLIHDGPQRRRGARAGA